MSTIKKWNARRKAKRFMRDGRYADAVSVIYDAYGENGIYVLIAMADKV